MKKLLLTLVLALPLLVIGQNSAGVITYMQTIKMDWKPPADMDAQMKAQIEEMRKHMPKSYSSYFELAFNEEMAHFQISPKQAEQNEQLNAEGGRPGGGRMMRMFGGADKINHWDLKKGTYVEKRTFFEREFLIKDQTEPLKWKIMGEAKEIAGFLCQKATAMVDTNLVEAWFCPTLPVPAGPDGYGQLPGMILELVTDEGRNTLTAESVEMKAVSEDEYPAPKGGKTVTKAEYKKIVDEKMAEMREEWKNRSREGGGGGRMHMENH